MKPHSVSVGVKHIRDLCQMMVFLLASLEIAPEKGHPKEPLIARRLSAEVLLQAHHRRVLASCLGSKFVS